MSGDLHRPTTAGPMPPPEAAGPSTTTSAPAPDGGGLPLGIPPDHPEILVGAAFAGGVVAAFLLKRLGGT